MNTPAQTSTAVDLTRTSEESIEQLVATLADLLRARGERLTTAESCTGGLIAGACTEMAGSSDWFERGFVTYSNAAKTELIDVPAALIASEGAVSEPVARAMALGALAHAEAQWSLAVTGVAGPGGGSAAKPVGTVWFGWAWRAQSQPMAESCTALMRFDGDRARVRQQTLQHALQVLCDLVRHPAPLDRP